MAIPAVQQMLTEFPPDQMKEGDIYIMNDPHGGGTHIPDIFIVIPVIYEGQTIALAMCIAHQVDMGGKTLGSKPMDATEIFQEGLIIPPMRLYDQGRRDDALFRILEKNSRLPQIVINDLQAQIAGCTIGRRRLLSLCEIYGRAIVLEAKDQLMAHSELMTRKEIKKMPEGTYSAVDYVDDDGVEVDRQVRIQTTVTIKGSDMTVDFSGTDPQTRGPINSTRSSTLGAVYYVVRAVTDPGIPNNAGCFRPIRVLTKRGSVVDPLPPAPVNARMPTVRIVADCMMQAMAKAVPSKVAAISASGGGPGFGGVDPLTGGRYLCKDFVSGGVGARPTKDGIDARTSGVGNSLTVPAEAIEMSSPIMVRQFSLWEDSCGAGKYQGGLGTIKVYEVTRGEATVIHQIDRQKTAPPGLFGGGSGTRQETYIIRKNGEKESVLSKAVKILQEGDRLVFKLPGGGGFGSPAQREREAIIPHLQDRRIFKGMAKERYGLVAGELEFEISL